DRVLRCGFHYGKTVGGLKICCRQALRAYDSDRADEAVPLPNDRLQETRLLGIVAQCLPNLAHGGINALLGIEKYVPAPEPRHDGLAADQLVAVLHQEDEELHGDFFQAEAGAVQAQLIALQVQFGDWSFGGAGHRDSPPSWEGIV